MVFKPGLVNSLAYFCLGTLAHAFPTLASPVSSYLSMLAFSVSKFSPHVLLSQRTLLLTILSKVSSSSSPPVPILILPISSCYLKLSCLLLTHLLLSPPTKLQAPSSQVSLVPYCTYGT